MEMEKNGQYARADGSCKQRVKNSKKKSKGKSRNKKTVTNMNNAFDSFISRLDTADERISNLEDKSIEMSST